MGSSGDGARTGGGVPPRGFQGAQPEAHFKPHHTEAGPLAEFPVLKVHRSLSTSDGASVLAPVARRDSALRLSATITIRASHAAIARSP
jgi:hypothetical protein